MFKILTNKIFYEKSRVENQVQLIPFYSIKLPNFSKNDNQLLPRFHLHSNEV